jgi:hypothetical protein
MANRLGKVLIGTEAERPTSSAELTGVLFVATDTDKLYRNSGAAWVELDGSAGAGGAHNLLDGGTAHSDSATDGVTRGSIIYGNATPAWDELTIGASGTILKSDGTDISWGTPAAPSFSGARVYRATDQTITNAGPADISFSDEHFDVGGYWAIGDPTKLVAPTDGYYLIGGQILWDSNTTAVRATYIEVDDTTYIASVSQAAASVANMQQNISALYFLAAGSYVKLVVNQTSTGDRVAEGATDFPHRGSQFWIARLGI